MGSIGEKGTLGYPIPEEPYMINNAKAVLRKAKEQGLLDANGKLDIKTFIAKNFSSLQLLLKPLESDISGELINNHGIWTMIINTKHPETRQRFTMSHELKHYISHRQESNKFSDSVFYRKNKEKDSLEYQADEFAAEILMPENYVRKAIDKGTVDVDRLADMFGVSGQAMLNRIKDLGYKTE